jgi:hypothetical protein
MTTHPSWNSTPKASQTSLTREKVQEVKQFVLLKKHSPTLISNGHTELLIKKHIIIKFNYFK